MKLHKDWHYVDFHGMQVPKPKRHPFLFANDNEHVCSSLKIPEHHGQYDFWVMQGDNAYVGQCFDLDGMDWKKSLVEYDEDGNIVHRKRRFWFNDFVVIQPSPDYTFVRISSNGNVYWSTHSAWMSPAVTLTEIQDGALEGLNTNHWQTSQRHIDELEEAL